MSNRGRGPGQGSSGGYNDNTCHRCRQSGHYAKDCPSTKKTSAGATPMSCRVCQKSGHKAADCPKNKQKAQPPKNKQKAQPPKNKHPKNDQPNQPTNNKRCFSCGKVGHSQKDCTEGPDPTKIPDDIVGPLNKQNLIPFIRKGVKLPDSGKISEHIKKFPELWRYCWSYVTKEAAQHQMDLVTMLTKARDSSLPAPPIRECCQVLALVSEAQTPKEILDRSEIVLNALTRLLDFLWNLDHSEVKERIKEVTTKLLINLAPHMALPDHQKLLQKIVAMVKELEKPWTIKTTASEPLLEPGNAALVPSWQSATVGWLSDENNFNPFLLPRMKVPSDKFQASCGLDSHFKMVGSV